MGFVSDVVSTFTGGGAADAAATAADITAESTQQAIDATQRSAQQALGKLEPFEAVGQQGLEQAGFLTDPQAQFDFLQENPLFKSALGAANTQTQNLAASRGRLSAGDTLQQLSQNVLLSASPLIQQQKQSITGLLGLGAGIAGQEANIFAGEGSDVADLISSQGETAAEAELAAANAEQAGLSNLLSAGLTAGLIF